MNKKLRDAFHATTVPIEKDDGSVRVDALVTCGNAVLGGSIIKNAESIIKINGLRV